MAAWTSRIWARAPAARVYMCCLPPFHPPRSDIGSGDSPQLHYRSAAGPPLYRAPRCKCRVYGESNPTPLTGLYPRAVMSAPRRGLLWRSLRFPIAAVDDHPPQCVDSVPARLCGSPLTRAAVFGLCTVSALSVERKPPQPNPPSRPYQLPPGGVRGAASPLLQPWRQARPHFWSTKLFQTGASVTLEGCYYSSPAPLARPPPSPRPPDSSPAAARAPLPPWTRTAPLRSVFQGSPCICPACPGCSGRRVLEPRLSSGFNWTWSRGEHLVDGRLGEQREQRVLSRGRPPARLSPRPRSQHGHESGSGLDLQCARRSPPGFFPPTTHKLTCFKGVAQREAHRAEFSSTNVWFNCNPLMQHAPWRRRDCAML